jgi:hypothetical protein
MALVGGKLERIEGKTSEDFEFIGEEITYTTFKELAISKMNQTWTSKTSSSNLSTPSWQMEQYTD